MQQHPADLARNWLAQAQQDLADAIYLAEGERYAAACFNSQQAAEKALKAVLVWRAGDRPRTHEIAVLLDELRTTPEGIDDSISDLAGLDPYYLTTRYPDTVGGGIPAGKFFAPEGRIALERARRALAFAERAIPPKTV